MLIIESLQKEIEDLSPALQGQLLDFIRLLKQRPGHPLDKA